MLAVRAARRRIGVRGRPNRHVSMPAALLAAALLLAAAPPAGASDRALLAALDARLAAVTAAGERAAGGDPRAVQAQYDAARDLQEALARTGPLSPSCRRLAGAATRLVGLELEAADGVDRIQPALTAAARARIPGAVAAIAPARLACRPGSAPRRAAIPALDAPRPGEAFFGAVAARAPAGAASAELRADGRPVAVLRVVRGVARARLRLAPGAHDLELRFLAGGRLVGVARSPAVWLLPRSGRSALPAARADRRLESRLRDLARGFAGTSALWLQDLTSGRAAGWNAEARFPAASTVKLGVLAAALQRMGPAPERSPLLADLAAMAGWSSNLATNRLLERIGGSQRAGAALAQGALQRLGGSSSTFPDGYLVGTELQPAQPPGRAEAPPPPASWRTTTARDLARALFALQATGAGGRRARAETGLSGHQARVALALLLASERRGDNLGLFAGGLSPGTPAAQKHGWHSTVRHSAAIVYTPRGPWIAVALTYRPGGARVQAAALGARLVALIGEEAGG